MTAKNRATLISKLHTALKKHFKPAPPSPGRPLMEHVLYASLLEDTPADLADEGFAKCEQEFFDWNEVRVTTATELAEVLSRLPSPTASAIRLKKNLQSMFEAFYNFDIDHLKKENLGKAVAKFEAMPGMTHFVLSYLVQHGLGGHAIPIDKSAMKLMWLAGIVSDAEADSGKVPGLERTIPKNRAIEFSSLLHQAGIAFQANNKDKAVWDVLLAVNKDAKALFDRPQAPPPPRPKKPTKTVEPPAKPAGKSAGKNAAKTPSGTKQPATAKSADKPKSAAAKPTSSKSKPAKPAVKPAAGKAPVAKPSSEKAVASTKTTVAKTNKADAKPAPSKEAAPAKPAVASGKTASKSTDDKFKKAVSEKASGDKSVSSKAAAKPASKKTEAKAPVKKPATVKGSEDLEPTKKGLASANKKLTKQKPR
jgi:hypothetical protein